MRDLISQMFRLPMTMAQMGIRMVFQPPGPDDKGGLPVLGPMVEMGQSLMQAMLQPLSAGAAAPPPPAGAAAPTMPTPGQMGVPARPPGPPPAPLPRVSPHRLGKLDVTTMVVLGDGLAAGLSDFALQAGAQRNSFPAQLAEHLGARFRQPMLQSPGFNFYAGSDVAHVPDLGQSTVYSEFPPPEAFSNPSVPGFTVGDALRLRPQPPLVHRHNAKQTAANFLIDPRALIDGRPEEAATLVESALGQGPTFLIVSLGFHDVYDAALARPVELPKLSSFRHDYEQILRAADETGTGLLVLTVPDPLDTAAFSSLEAAGRVLKMPAAALRELYDLEAGDYLTVEALFEIGSQILGGEILPLDERHVLAAADAERIRSQVRAMNEELTKLASKHHAAVADLAGLARRLAEGGVAVGGRHLTSDLLGGFYSLNGFTPGASGQALIANEAIGAINRHFDASIPPVDAGRLLAQDAVANSRLASGKDWTLAELQGIPRGEAEPDDVDCGGCGKSSHHRDDSQPSRFRTMEDRYNTIYRNPPPQPLQLPAGLVQELPLETDFSYYGDAILAVNCGPEVANPATGCPGTLFGGLAMFAGNLNGSVHIRFTQPVGDVTHFEVSLGEGLLATDGQLAAPRLFKLPVRQGVVRVFPGKVCSGDLNLKTGDTTNLDFNFQFFNTALGALVRVNPDFPQVPIQYPGQYGTGLVRFVQRDDGKLDFIFSGTAFAPLGPTARFPLPLASAAQDFASIPGSGSALHPHLHLSTMDLSVSEGEGDGVKIPTNTVQEFTPTVARTDFGDDFTLDNPVLGFARGRSQLSGRFLVQFSERVGDFVQFAVSAVPPGGLLYDQDITPIQSVFSAGGGGKLNQGMLGHSGVLRFPLREYRQNDLYFMNDPLDISWGMINMRTGEVLGDHLHRVLFGQNLFFSLIRVEPRTPQGSFEYRGPGLFEQTADGQLRFRFNGTVYLYYQPGFKFPKPNMADGFVIGNDSALDPYFQIDAVGGDGPHRGSKSGSGNKLTAPTGETFSYRYSISSEAGRQKPQFEYTNHAQQSTFTLKSLTYVRFGNAGGRRGGGESDIITFAGFGTWSRDPEKDRLHAVNVQISTAAGDEYVTIMVGGGQVSLVESIPKNPRPPLTGLPSASKGLLEFGHQEDV